MRQQPGPLLSLQAALRSHGVGPPLHAQHGSADGSTSAQLYWSRHAPLPPPTPVVPAAPVVPEVPVVPAIPAVPVVPPVLSPLGCAGPAQAAIKNTPLPRTTTAVAKRCLDMPSPSSSNRATYRGRGRREMRRRRRDTPHAPSERPDTNVRVARSLFPIRARYS